MVTIARTKQRVLDGGSDRGENRLGINPDAYSPSKIGQLNRAKVRSPYPRPGASDGDGASGELKFYSGSHSEFS